MCCKCPWFSNLWEDMDAHAFFGNNSGTPGTCPEILLLFEPV